MKPKKDTHKVGAKAKPRGQQMGTAGAIDQNRNAMQDTPAVLGRRRGTVRKNRLFLECGGSTPLWSAARIASPVFLLRAHHGPFRNLLTSDCSFL
jgi:hypothetical protein